MLNTTNQQVYFVLSNVLRIVSIVFILNLNLDFLFLPFACLTTQKLRLILTTLK